MSESPLQENVFVAKRFRNWKKSIIQRKKVNMVV